MANVSSQKMKTMKMKLGMNFDKKDYRIQNAIYCFQSIKDMKLRSTESGS